MNEPRTYLVNMTRLNVGRYTYGFDDIQIHHEMPGVEVNIGSFCSIAKGLTVYAGGNHRLDWVTTYPFGHVNIDVFPHHGIGHPTTRGSVNIGNDVWIGRNVTIMSGVTIGNGSCLAANSVITKDVLPYSIVGGNPAKVIRKRFSDKTIEKLERLSWWDWDINKIKDNLNILCSDNFESLLLSITDDIEKKKNCIIFSGEYRTFEKTKEKLQEFIKLNNFDVYCHLWSYEKERVEEINKYLSPKLLLVEDCDRDRFHNEADEIVRETKFIRNLKHNDNLPNLLAMHYARKTIFDKVPKDFYENIIFCRYDIMFKNLFEVDRVEGVITPEVESWGTVSDIFAIMNAKEAKHFFLYENIKNLYTTEFEPEFVNFLRLKHKDEAINHVQYERFCPHTLLLRNLFLSKTNHLIMDIPICIQR